MKQIYSLCFFALLLFEAKSQKAFQKLLLSEARSDLKAPADGTYLWCGSDKDCAALGKFDAQGNLLWSRKSCAQAGFNKHMGFELAPSVNQTVWAISTQQRTNGEIVYFLNRFSGDGAFMYGFDAGFAAYQDFGPYLTSTLTSDPEGNAWMVEHRGSITQASGQKKSTFVLLRCDALSGNAWRKTLTYTNSNDLRYYVSSILATDTDHIYIAGNAVKDAGLSTSATQHSFITCLDKNGQVRWSRRYDELKIDHLKSHFANGDLLVTGTAGANTCNLARINAGGSVVWYKRQTNQPYRLLAGMAFVTPDNDNIWFATYNNKDKNLSFDSSMIYKLDQSGNCLLARGFWNCSYQGIRSAATTVDQGFAFIWKNDQGSILTKVDASGSLGSGCPERGGALLGWENKEAPSGSDLPVSIMNQSPPAEVALQWYSGDFMINDYCPNETFAGSFSLPDTICEDLPLTVSALELPGYSFLWEIPSGSPVKGASPDFSFTFETPGFHGVRLITRYGFCFDTLDKKIEVVGSPPHVPLPDRVLCGSIPVHIDVGLPGMYTYSWEDGSNGPERTCTIAGQYTLTIRDDHCSLRDSFFIDSFIFPVLFPDSVRRVCAGSLITPATGGKKAIKWLWDGQPAIPPFETGDSSLWHGVSVLYESGCQQMDSVFLETEDCTDYEAVYIPNCISLNPASRDQVFAINAPYAEPLSSAVYDRWGNKLYASNVGEWPKWDGYFRGKPVEAGVYVFVCSLKMPTGKEKTFVKDITAIH